MYLYIYIYIYSFFTLAFSQIPSIWNRDLIFYSLNEKLCLLCNLAVNYSTISQLRNPVGSLCRDSLALCLQEYK